MTKTIKLMGVTVLQIMKKSTIYFLMFSFFCTSGCSFLSGRSYVDRIGQIGLAKRQEGLGAVEIWSDGSRTFIEGLFDIKKENYRMTMNYRGKIKGQSYLRYYHINAEEFKKLSIQLLKGNISKDLNYKMYKINDKERAFILKSNKKKNISKYTEAVLKYSSTKDLIDSQYFAIRVEETLVPSLFKKGKWVCFHIYSLDSELKGDCYRTLWGKICQPLKAPALIGDGCVAVGFGFVLIYAILSDG